jgi:aryl-alcohol dehydrogenase-like predicted oxidoreductase
VVKANQYAKYHGKSPFVIYQGRWCVFDRSLERDIIPMARSEGLAIAPWGVLGAGKVRTDAEEERRRESGEKGSTLFDKNWERTEEERKVCLVLEDIAKEVGAHSITAGERFSDNSLLHRVGVSADPICDRSGYRIPPPEDAVCIPNRWRPQG